ncbi:MAG: Deoxycytidine triphosphate deaminase [bacterium ADurb.Bin400]|nr:MAG: Deoxycytidine triphosphate deaminase [bacterium ADurb.Bin400]
MSVLTRGEIIKEIKRGNIKIDPLDESSIGPGSVDLRLGNKFRTFKRADQVYDVNESLNYRDLTELVETDTIVVQPGETILGITMEKITLASNLCGWLEGRSRFARLGLMVHISASFMQPGISNHQVFEISNMGHVPLRLHAGTRFCQFVFQRTIGKATYAGTFEGQTEP